MDVGESRIRLLLPALEGVFCGTGDLTWLGESRVILPCNMGEEAGPGAVFEGEKAFGVLRISTGARPTRTVLLVSDDEDELSSG